MAPEGLPAATRVRSYRWPGAARHSNPGGKEINIPTLQSRTNPAGIRIWSVSHHSQSPCGGRAVLGQHPHPSSLRLPFKA